MTKSKFLNDKVGYSHGASATRTKHWPMRLIKELKDSNFSNMAMAATFIAHFARAYGNNLNLTDVFENKDFNFSPAYNHLTDWYRKNRVPIPTDLLLTEEERASLTPEERVRKEIETMKELDKLRASNPVSEVVEVKREKTPEIMADTWHQIKSWRENQALTDWKMAETLRNHVRMICAENTIIVPERDARGREVLDASGRPKMKYKSNLKANEVKCLADAATSIQKIQRLAIGLSTENVGVDLPTKVDEPHLEKNVIDIPTFVVEVSEAGKFEKPRPRRIR
jgi:hypothetical protein